MLRMAENYLPASDNMFKGCRGCASRKSGTGGGGLLHPKGETAWPCLGLAVKSPVGPYLLF